MGVQQSRPTQRYRHGNLSHLSLLVAAVAQHVYRSEYKPPVTLGLIAANSLLYVSRAYPGFPLQLPDLPIHKYSLQPYRILEGHQWARLYVSAFLHQDEPHLCYNMTSLLWKGAQLETARGSWRFAALVGELLLVSHSLVAGLSWALKEMSPEYAHLYYSVGSVGFSAVLFGLKVVLYDQSPGYSSIMGVTLPTKYMCWVELLIAQVANPQASFLGHVCGILAGLLHVKVTSKWVAALSARLRRFISGGGPGSSSNGGSRQYFSSRGTSGHAPAPAPRPSSSAPSTTASGRQHPAGHSAQQQAQGGEGHVLGGEAERQQPSMEELRQRRLARFSGT